MKDLSGETVLARVVNRTRRARMLDDVVVATTGAPADDLIVRECERLGVSCFRGDEDDVLDRYYRAALEYRADAVVRVTSDCPVTDPGLVDEHVSCLLKRWSEVDFVTNMAKQTYPLGLAVEAMPVDVLRRMKRMSRTDELKEHVTTLAYAQPSWFQIHNVSNEVDLSYMRWTVDTAEDLELVRLIFANFEDDKFLWREVLTLLERHPEWHNINQHLVHKAVG